MYVMKPLSYSRCAVRIVRCAVKRSLRADSCCKDDVMNGAYGFWVNGFFWTSATAKRAPGSAAARPSARSLPICSVPAFCAASVSAPVPASKSREVATRLPNASTSSAVIVISAPVGTRVAVRP